jgi:hypothetical protein
MLRIPRSQRRPGQGQIHLQPRHRAVSYTRLTHLFDFGLAVHRTREHGHGRLGVVHRAAVGLFANGGRLALENERDFEGAGGAAGDVVDD